MRIDRGLLRKTSPLAKPDVSLVTASGDVLRPSFYILNSTVRMLVPFDCNQKNN